jgi:dihydropyrimidine dehydrogenase (NAD+) subunit PreA
MDLVEAELEWLTDLGIEFVLNKTIPFISGLRDEFDAVVLATGFSKSLQPELPGIELKSVYQAKAVLRAHKLGESLRIGKRVIVVGGGNAAIDSAQAAYLMGAKEVTVVYRRSEAEMPAWEREIRTAKKIGVQFRYLAAPLEIKGSTRPESVVFQLMKLGREESGKRREVEAVPDVTFEIEADTVIFGIGEKPHHDFFESNKIEFKEGQNKTNCSDVYCAGDLTATGKSIVHAVGDGKSCAKAVLESFDINYRANPINDYYKNQNVDLTTVFCGVSFENPFVLAAAPPTDDLEMLREAFKAGWAGAVLKTTSVESNNVPLKYPMMKGVELGNKRVMALGNIDLISEHHIDVVEKRVRTLKEEFPRKVVIASIMGEKKEDWQSLVKRLEAAGVDIIECSFSCPQGTLGSKPGFMLGQDPEAVRTVAGWVKEAADHVPVVIKITPMVTDIVEIAKAVKEAGADAICASNSIPSIPTIDINSFVPEPNVGGKSTYSGLSGPAIKPLSLRTIAEIKRHVDIPITGTGGPVTWQDAIEMMSVGATNVQFCTAVMHYGFDLINDLCSGLTYYMLRKNLNSPEDIIGKSLPFITTHDELVQKRKVVSNIDQRKCVNCGACFVACRDGGHKAILFDESTRQIRTDIDKCVGCGFCPSVCPVEDCLTMKEL